MRCAIVGAGHMGKLHAAALSQVSGLTLVSVVDIEIARAQELSKAFGGLPTDSLGEAIVLTNPEVAIIATPALTHFAIAKRLIEANCHCFIEKPVSASVEDAEELSTLATRRGLTLGGGHQELFSPAARWLRTNSLQPVAIRCERTGLLANRTSDVSVVLDLMIHDIELVQTLFGGTSNCISAIGSHHISSTRLIYDNGMTVDYLASRASLRRSRVWRVCERNRTLTIDFYTGRVTGYHYADYEQAIASMEGENLEARWDPYEELNKRLKLIAWAPETSISRLELLGDELDDFIQQARSRASLGFPPTVLQALRAALAVEHETIKFESRHKLRVVES